MVIEETGYHSSLSTAEAEYIATSASATQAIWLRRVLEEFGGNQKAPTKIFCDNSSAIGIAKNSVFHDRCKHIKVHYHYIQELVKKNEIELHFCRSENQVTDIFSKPLTSKNFVKL
uniref:Retrovirus-related Pol polyprotein from transposon TNT 1-94 n=1 Tax=Ananas comosus var. bracteatus TaxID=296719 RepID=A0A6V7NWJ2_ANACO|nr:unnamed protein product [Ananas comosus var. bracteatus]